MITFKSLNFNIDDTFNYNNLIKEYEEYIDDNMGKFTCPLKNPPSSSLCYILQYKRL